jgi:hypothetical protein
MWFVELPSETQVAIGVAIMVLVNILASFVVAYVPWLDGFIGKYKEEWAIALSGIVVVWLQNVLPEAYPDLSVLAVQFVVGVVLALLAKYGLAKAKVKAFIR